MNSFTIKSNFFDQQLEEEFLHFNEEQGLVELKKYRWWNYIYLAFFSTNHQANCENSKVDLLRSIRKGFYFIEKIESLKKRVLRILKQIKDYANKSSLNPDLNLMPFYQHASSSIKISHSSSITD